MNQTHVVMMIVSLAASLLSSLVIEINRIAKNLENDIKKPNILYLANTLQSTICGCTLGLASGLLTDEIVVWILTSIIGAFLGLKSFKLVFHIIFKFLKSDDFMKAIDTLDKVVDEPSKDKLPTKDKEDKTKK